jgi:hypothetical protein
MQRNRGQFTSSKSKGEDPISGITGSEGSPNWGSVEGRPPSAAEYDSLSHLGYTLINITVKVALPFLTSLFSFAFFFFPFLLLFFE